MKLPPNHTENEVLRIIDKVVNQLAPSFRFGCWDLDDLKQFGRLKALELLEKGTYEVGRPLEAYIYTHCRNRYINLRRDELTRYDPPCEACAAGTFCNGDTPCEKFACWQQRNHAKANLQRPIDIDHVADEVRMHRASEVEAEASINESLRLIDANLPVELRSDYLKMRAGVSVPKMRRIEVERAVSEILKGDVECPSQDD